VTGNVVIATVLASCGGSGPRAGYPRQSVPRGHRELQHDFNIGSWCRTANAFLAAEVTIVGLRRWNRRGAMVTDRYQHVRPIPTRGRAVAWVGQGLWRLIERQYASVTGWPYPADQQRVKGEGFQAVLAVLLPCHRSSP